MSVFILVLLNGRAANLKLWALHSNFVILSINKIDYWIKGLSMRPKEALKL